MAQLIRLASNLPTQLVTRLPTAHPLTSQLLFPLRLVLELLFTGDAADGYINGTEHLNTTAVISGASGSSATVSSTKYAVIASTATVTELKHLHRQYQDQTIQHLIIAELTKSALRSLMP
jgi:hypothetical protein